MKTTTPKQDTIHDVLTSFRHEHARLETLATVDAVCIEWLKNPTAPAHVRDRAALDLLAKNRDNLESDMYRQIQEAIEYAEYGGILGYRWRCYNAPGSIGQSWLDQQ